MDREHAIAAFAEATQLEQRLRALADALGPLDTRKRGDRAIADALRRAQHSVAQLAELLRSVGGPLETPREP
jgi:hypothetical protein